MKYYFGLMAALFCLCGCSSDHYHDTNDEAIEEQESRGGSGVAPGHGGGEGGHH